MSEYIHFTKEERQQAASADIAEFLRSNGEELKRTGSEYEWRDGVEKISIRGNLWYNQYLQKGGDAIGFLIHVYGKPYAEAVQILLGDSIRKVECSESRENIPKPEKVLLPPERNNRESRVLAYLIKERGIDKDVLYYFIRQGLLYEDKKYHNAIFVGKDEEGVIRHIHKRGTRPGSQYKGNHAGSQPEYSFHHVGISDKLYAFEAPIDMLSYITMRNTDWKEDSYVALCSVSDKAILHLLEKNGSLKTVVLCLDNDKAGLSAVDRIRDKLEGMGYMVREDIPTEKDWNQQLLVEKQGLEAEKICPVMNC